MCRDAGAFPAPCLYLQVKARAAGGAAGGAPAAGEDDDDDGATADVYVAAAAGGAPLDLDALFSALTAAAELWPDAEADADAGADGGPPAWFSDALAAGAIDEDADGGGGGGGGGGGSGGALVSGQFDDAPS